MGDCGRSVNAALLVAVATVLLWSCRGADPPSREWLRALNAVDEGRHDLARADLERVLAERPDDLEVCTLLARSWSKGTMQSPSKAIEAWRRCAVIEATDEGRVEIARAHLRLGAVEETLKALDGAAASAEVHRVRGEALLRLDPAAAVAEAERALERFPDDAGLLDLAGRAAELAGDPVRAWEHVSRALELDPLDDRLLYLQGRLLQSLDRPDEATTAFARYELVSRLRGSSGPIEPPATQRLRLLDELGVSDGAALAWRIELLAEVGRRDEAVEAIEGVLSDREAAPALMLRVEEVAVALGRLATARRLLERVESSSPGPAVLREVRYRRARLRHLDGDPAGALGDIESLLAEEPWVARLLDLRGRLQAASGDEAAARGSFSRALELAPWRADTRLALCELELRHAGRERVQRLLDEAPEASAALDAFRRRHGLT